MTRLFAVALAAALTPLATIADQIDGTVTYLQRIMLPPGAVLTVSLEDVSRADAPSDVIATQDTRDPGAPPFAFALPYDATRIDPARSYSMSARIELDGELMMITDTVYPVLTGGADTHADMILRMTGSDDSAKPDSDVVNTYWKVLTLGGAPVTVQTDMPEPHLILRSDGRYSATAGCNTIIGEHTVTAEAVTFHPGAATLMACAPPIDQLERALIAMLEQAARFEVSGEEMRLLNTAGESLATFRAIYF